MQNQLRSHITITDHTEPGHITQNHHRSRKISLNLIRNSTFLSQNCQNFSKFYEFFLLELFLFWKHSFNNFSKNMSDFSKNNVEFFFSNLWICWDFRHSLEFKIACDIFFLFLERLLNFFCEEDLDVWKKKKMKYLRKILRIVWEKTFTKKMVVIIRQS